MSSSTPADPPSARPAPPADAAAAIIGVARMEKDGTLVLDLHARSGGAIGMAQRRYAPDHPEYKRVLDHLGGMKPGEEKGIPPWPDPWDAAKVEASAHAHAAKKGWTLADYALEITGTDAEGNAVVSLRHAGDPRPRAPGTRRSVELRIDPKSYAVVRETPAR